MQAVLEAGTTTGALVSAGGPVAWLLVGLSVFALGLVLAKAAQFRRLGLNDGAAAQALALWRDGREAAARSRAWASADPAARALARTFEGRRRGLPETMVRDEAARAAEADLDALRSWLKPLEVIAATAPLLGLFGTVLGMIDAFAALEASGAQVDPAALSGGIWVALLTTAFGLAVAMPTVAALAAFERRVERAERAVDDALAAAFTVSLEPRVGASSSAESHARRLAEA